MISAKLFPLTTVLEEENLYFMHYFAFLILASSVSFLTIILKMLRAYSQNPAFSNPRFFETPDNSNQTRFLPLSNTTSLPSISQISRFLEPIFVSLRGSRNRDSTVILTSLIPLIYSFGIRYGTTLHGFVISRNNRSSHLLADC